MSSRRESHLPKKPIYKRKWPWALLAAIAMFVIFIGPWPTYSSHYRGSDYAETTFARIGALDSEPGRGPLLAGAATAEITPPVGEPMAGYSARNPNTSKGAGDRIYAKAITLANGRNTVTIVGGDILLFLPELRDEVLGRVKLPPEEVYFCSTHTHSGPGGYSSRWVDQVAMGRFDRKILHRLADAFAKTITRSRGDLKPAEIFIGHCDNEHSEAKGYVFNRISAALPAHGTVSVLSVKPAGGKSDRPSAMLVVASAHPTCYRKGNRLINADYPGVVQRGLERQFGCVCMFAGGAVGSMAPAEDLPAGRERANDIGEKIAEIAAHSRGDRRFTNQASISAAILDVDLPVQQYRISEHLRLSPIAAGYLHDRKTYVHVLRVNEALLLGMPCDYSGELAAGLEAWAAGRHLTPIVTSFNGDYIGYLLPQSRYASGHYEARDMNLFGPWCGEYFDEISRRLIRRLAPQPAPGPTGGD